MFKYLFNHSELSEHAVANLQTWNNFAFSEYGCVTYVYGIIVRLCYGMNRLLHVTDRALWFHECCFLALLKFWTLWGQQKSKQALIYIPRRPYCMQIYPWTFSFEEVWWFYLIESNYESRNQELSVKTNTKMCFNLHSSMKYFPASTNLGNQTWNRKLQTCFSNLTTPTSLKSKCRVEVSVACINVDTHLHNLFSAVCFFSRSFWQADWFREQDAKLRQTMCTVITPENCVQQIFDKCTNNLLAARIPTSTIANKNQNPTNCNI